jgi:hypothetical protein
MEALRKEGAGSPEDRRGWKPLRKKGTFGEEKEKK